MSVIASQRVLFLVLVVFKVLFPWKRGRELEWYHGKVGFGSNRKPKRAIIAASFSSPKLEREGFLLSTTYGTMECAFTVYEENWHGTFRCTNPG
ncbi:MAG: hypothetical protein OXD54_14255 [Candidatus Poribacteria bacterium]|nr:hypothetical protein [Candidatus Poribacteria bacterium]